MQVSVTEHQTTAAIDAEYHALESAVAATIRDNRAPLFTTTASGEALWVAYLAGYPAEVRQYYTCHCCRHFIERFGGLVTLDEAGIATPFLWEAGSLHALVLKARVDGAFRWDAESWGIATNVSQKSGAMWTHLHGIPAFHHARGSLTPFQQMAALAEDVGILNRSLDDYTLPAVQEAVRVLESGALMRSEKAEGVAKWFLALHQSIAEHPKRRHNLVWRAVSSAPPGFAHVRTTVLSTLLDDIVAGLSFAEVSRRWSEKLHPLQYQRPTKAPRAGQIEAAERKVRELGIEPSFARRFATLDDVLSKLWEQKTDATKVKTGGMFALLREDATKVKGLELPAQAMTWEKFRRDVLPGALSIEVNAPTSGGYYGLVTAVNVDAPAIIQWDGLEGHPRNPVSWYFYHGSSSAAQWGILVGWNPVSAVFLPPFQWQEPDKFAHQGKNAFFAISAAKDSRAASLCLFPEILRAELREIRSVIEAYNGKMHIEGREGGTANGLAFSGASAVRVRVRSATGLSVYDLDRWE